LVELLLLLLLLLLILLLVVALPVDESYDDAVAFMVDVCGQRLLSKRYCTVSFVTYVTTKIYPGLMNLDSKIFGFRDQSNALLSSCGTELTGEQRDSLS
jgi:hypothetical protein